MPNSEAVGVLKFEDKFAAATIWAPVVRSENVTVLKPRIAPSWPTQSPVRRRAEPVAEGQAPRRARPEPQALLLERC